MQPRNKFQRQVVEASKSLPPITAKQIQWAYDNCIEHIGRRTKRGKITCSKCGHIWQGMGELINTLLGTDCPNCKTKLNVLTTTKRVFDGCTYMIIITAHKGYQVLRTMMIKCKAKIGNVPEYWHAEVMQRWIAVDGKHATLARLRQTMGTMYIDSWLFHTPLELRSESANNKFCINIYDKIGFGEVYPIQKLIPEIKRTGYKKALYNQMPLDLFRILLTDSRAETLLKTGQTKLLQRILDMGWKTNIDKYWASIRICLRNNYQIEDATLWCDYIDFLSHLGKDLHNAKYVCPEDLNKEHDRYMRKKAKADALIALEKQLEKEAEFRKVKEKFFGIMFSDGLIQVRVLESIAEIIEEGKIMHHCVSSYSSKEDSLILSACINGKKIETIEISLSELKLIQCRGKCNGYSEYHNRIVNLVNNNLPLIEERLAA